MIMREKEYFFDKPENVKRLLVIFFCALGVLLIADRIRGRKNPAMITGAFGFFASYGFVSCVLLIYIAKGLRRLVKRDEAYYEGRDRRDDL